jgi:limonene-1,2-epoxide hydrolase
MAPHIPVETSSLRALFTKPYGAPAPTEAQWRAAYSDNVVFEDPTQKHQGLDAYLAAQEGLLRRCDDVLLKPLAIAIDGNTAFVEWEMGLKIKGIEFIYPGSSRLLFNDEGKIVDHRDYFDFVGPTFEPVPVIGSFVRWLYKRFVA